MRMRRFSLSGSVRLGVILPSLILLAAIAAIAVTDVAAKSAPKSPTPNNEASHRPEQAAAGCATAAYKDADYVVCRFDAAADIRLFLNNAEAEPYGHFNAVNEALGDDGEKLRFAMNAGMYHADRTPVGHYAEDGEEITPANTKAGMGNFHLKPNGVFWVEQKDGARGAGVATTQSYLEHVAKETVRYATQSGPMLVIDGEVHPRFLPQLQSNKRRNGVGVTAQGEVIFVLADSPVNFYDFASYFRDVLKTPNALYLDGTISRFYAPALGRNDPGAAMGPIVGVVVKE